MKTRWGLALAAALALVVPGAGLGQGRVWVASTGAKLKSAASGTAATVGDVEVGTELGVVGTDGKWYQVTTPDGRRGWIFGGKVSSSAPEAAEGSLFGSLPGSQIQARASDTARSVRGLSPETTEYAKAAGTPQVSQDALDRVLALRVDDAEVERFLQQGRIGEYAR
jgi:uncharacterized protein YgiM (DUF1202 family)